MISNFNLLSVTNFHEKRAVAALAVYVESPLPGSVSLNEMCSRKTVLRVSSLLLVE